MERSDTNVQRWDGIPTHGQYRSLRLRQILLDLEFVQEAMKDRHRGYAIRGDCRAELQNWIGETQIKVAEMRFEMEEAERQQRRNWLSRADRSQSLPGSMFRTRIPREIRTTMTSAPPTPRRSRSRYR